MKVIQSLTALQEEIAVWHAALAIGGGYDLLKKTQPKLYKRMARVSKACITEANKRAKRKKHVRRN